MSEAVQKVEFLHSCHVPVVNSDRIEFITKGTIKDASELNPKWLQGAIEQKFCKRVEPAAADPASPETSSGAPEKE